MVRSGSHRLYVSVAAALPAAVALAGCAPPPRAHAAAQSAEVARTLRWDGGDRLQVGGASEVRYVPGPADTVTITGPQDEVDRMVVRHGAIYEEPSPSWWGQLFGGGWRQGRVRIVLVTSRLSQVGLSSASNIDLGRLTQDRLELHVSGASHATASGAIGKVGVSASGASGVTLDGLKSDEVDAGLSGASWVKASGEARTLLLQASGASHADLAGLGLDEAEAQLSGAGGAVLAPKRQAQVGVSGGAHVRLTTRPASLQVHRSGGGSVVGPDGPEQGDWDRGG